MIRYTRTVLDNGLRLLVHEDPSTELVAVNIVYDVGSKDESPDRTGFAHLFEHLMFGGSEHAASFDDPIQYAGGECNAFTNSDLTNFFCLLPADNLELALFLEADRMQHLVLNKRTLTVQRNVVTEEFKETCLQEPYGDMWHQFAPLAYQQHTYRWPTIGMSLQHIEEAQIEDVASFYKRFYGPNNAVCVIAGNVKAEEAIDLASGIFGKVPARHRPVRSLPHEEAQHSQRRLTCHGDVPVDALYMGFHMPARSESDYYRADLLSDVLAGGKSTRLFENLVKEKELCAEIDAYITGTIDPGLFMIEAKPADSISVETVEEEIWKLISDLHDTGIAEEELQTHQNKVESSIFFANCSVLNKAINLAYFELIDQPELINLEHQAYQSVSADDMLRVSRRILRPENCSVLQYRAGKV